MKILFIREGRNPVTLDVEFIPSMGDLIEVPLPDGSPGVSGIVSKREIGYNEDGTVDYFTIVLISTTPSQPLNDMEKNFMAHL